MAPIADASSATLRSFLVDNVSWDFVPYFDAQYNFTDKWHIGATVYYFDQFAYPIPLDQYSTQIVDSNGNRVAQSQGHADSFWSIASVGYNLNDHFELSAGLWDQALPKTTDNRTVLPWFLDPYALATNDFTMFVDLTASY